MSQTAVDAGSTPRAIARTTSRSETYLLRLTIEDERRQLRLFEEWCNSLRSDAELRAVEPQVPHLGSAIEASDVKDAVARFLAVERADRHDLARLWKEVRQMRDTTVWSVLTDVMDLDTRMHIERLRFLDRHPTA
jgi:hypothetical protein